MVCFKGGPSRKIFIRGYDITEKQGGKVKFTLILKTQILREELCSMLQINSLTFIPSKPS